MEKLPSQQDIQNSDIQKFRIQKCRLLMVIFFLQFLTALSPSQRITKQWQDIGFQGDDPGTDFRGMGMLGLHNLM
jgi:hypothetical protein